MSTSYQTDVIAWANEQVALLRSGNLSAIDIEHIAEEIEDVGKSEQRELANRMAALLAHLLKWEYQPERRGSSWSGTILAQRKAIAIRVRKTPSLNASLTDLDWWEGAWADAVGEAVKETGIAFKVFPETCPWPVEQVMSETFFPD